MSIKVGSKLKFDSDKTFRWEVKAIDHPFMICTTAGPKGLYTIIDLARKIRGPDNCYGVGYSSEAQIKDALAKLKTGDIEISNRHKIPLIISEVLFHD